jgi:hypothetical protein
MVLLQPIQLEQQAEHQAVELEEMEELLLLGMDTQALHTVVEVAVLIMVPVVQTHTVELVEMVAYE